MAGSRLAALPLIVMLAGGLGLALAGCGASTPAESAPVTVTVTASAPTVTVTASAAAPAVAGGNPACPSAAAVSAAAGTAYLPPVAKTAAGALDCSYEANSGFLLISLAKATSPASALRQVAHNQAVAAGGVKISPVSGIGDAAYLLTFNGDGKTERELLLESGAREITVLGADGIEQIKAIARVAIAS